MTFIGHIALYGWPLLVVPLLFLLLPARLAAFVGVIFGWLFLPFGMVDVPGPLELDKFGACTLTVLGCVGLFDAARLVRFRLALVDVPMLLWMFSPSISSMTNGLGMSDAISGLFHQLVMWGIPYFLGRVYITDGKSLLELALVVVFAGVAYTPFVLWEARMSPRLHAQLYGFVTYTYGGMSTRRFNGWRPVVFQQHGLMLGLLMASVAVVAGWLWYSGAWRRFSPFSPFRSSERESWRTWSGISRRTRGVGGSHGAASMVVPTLPLVLGLIVVAVLCRALNALILMVMVGAVLVALKNPIWKTRLGLICLLVVPVIYMGNRLAPSVIGVSLDQPIVQLASMVDSDRASSMQFRVDSERMLADHALQRPVFGWAGWGRNRVFNEKGEDVSVTDGLWIIVLGVNGLFGLAVWYLAMTGPIWVLVLRYPARALASAAAGPAVALSVIVLMFVVDCLPNAMVTVIQPLAVGGLAGLVVAMRGESGRSHGAAHRSRPVDRGRDAGPVSRSSRAVPAGVGV